MYYQTSVIETSVEYIPDLSDVSKWLLIQLRKKYENSCSKKHGYILRVNKLVEIDKYRISIYNGNVIVNCKIEIDHLLPKKDMLIPYVSSDIKQVFPQGKVITKDNMKIFIPNEYTGSSSQIRIMDIRFQKGKYDCIGSTIE
jgi:DNA-directed RNA polymerase subunit E'/Rpb7